ncbi:hypothetical protein SDC9_187641 [bioreactor metagenome]|uniref:Uncharacterized protein n=1 Tax=bioreactor metagenome TaxID=1076179 RepID=A0A645HNF5_9ZZZZ
MKNTATVLILGICALIPFVLLFFLCLVRHPRENTIGGTSLASYLDVSFCGLHFTLYPTWGSILLLGMGILLILCAFLLLALKPVS